MKPLNVAVSAVIDCNKILLLKREKEPYKSYWCLPGGKVEFGEHISEAALREIKEETGLSCEFVKLNGIYTEMMKQKDEIIASFIFFLTTLKPKHTDHIESEEGELKWVDLDEIKNIKEQMIDNDYMAIKKFIIEKDGFYYETEMEKQENNKYPMTRFEKMN